MVKNIEKMKDFIEELTLFTLESIIWALEKGSHHLGYAMWEHGNMGMFNLQNEFVGN